MLQISEHCSAGCNHCSFKSNQIFYSLEFIKKMAVDHSEPFVTITGGEPLEHPHFFEIVRWLSAQDIAFRVATGGHIPLHHNLSALSQIHGFLGINLGTDVPSRRNFDLQKKMIWRENLRSIQKNDTPWSLTFTLGNDFLGFPILEEIERANMRPDFLMINELSGESQRLEFIKKIGEGSWKNIKCL